MRWVLAPLSLPYALVLALRNRYYHHTPSASHAADIPVISVGNITLGGTGKTPLVIEFVRILRERGRRPAILTRGYCATATEQADEVLEYRAALPDTPVVVEPDRVAGVRIAHQEHQADCVVLDDGFQHRRLRRDLDIVLIDALMPWGGGLVPPAGRLREPLPGLARADLFVISRRNQASADQIAAIEATIGRHHPRPTIVFADVEPHRVVHARERVEQPDELAFRAVMPVCGIGNPATFLRVVDGLAGRVCRPMIYRDHHRYTARDARCLADQARRQGADLVLVTRKDWVKLAAHWPPSGGEGECIELARLDMRLRLRDEDDVIGAELDRILAERK